MKLRIVPITLREAHAFVAEHHRHHRPAQGGIFAVAVAEGLQVHGVAVVGRPVARRLQEDGFTAEVTRLATDGAKNACSMLYAACWRAARAMGYLRLVTYILRAEPGTSLRASGWQMVATTREGAGWSRDARPRVDLHPLQAKLRWEITA
ncbi:MAG TPA: XF1762 family protein [Acidobacteriaceae bacterium]|nr:XF1762 family protein [Acidobacteriaceae bacterium]